jgi:acetyl esterase/lipase
MPKATFTLAIAVAAALLLASACAADSLDDSPPAPLDDAAAYARRLNLDGVTAATFDGVVVHKDLEYARYGDTALLLDLYRPRQQQDKLPCVITITGGGFRAGNKTRFAPMAAYLAANGYAAACISYRGTPDDTFPTSVHDTKAAVRFVRRHADAFGIDGQRIGAFGQSAGGQMSVILAVTSGVDEME